MSRPKAYDPQPGYKYQILCKNPAYDRTWDHCDYAVDRADRRHLVTETRLAYGPGWEFKSILLPVKCWPSSVKRAEDARRHHRLSALTRPHGRCERAGTCVEHAANPRVEACSAGSR